MQSERSDADVVTCECPVAGFCQRRQRHVTSINHRRCQGGQIELVDRLMLILPREPKAEKAIAIARRKTGYGDNLAKIIYRETGEQTTCTGCQNEIGSLNWMSREDVLADIDGLCQRIRIRASLKARAWWQRWGCKLAQGIAEQTIRRWVLESIEEAAQVTPVPVGPRCGIRIVTSFSPRNTERQQHCLRTWLKIGCDVIAVQKHDEIDEMQQRFPDVTFHGTEKVADAFQKPNHIRISALIEQCNNEPGLLLNSDIEIASTVDEFIQLWSYDKNEFRIGIRWDKDPRTGMLYLQKYGIDAFFVTPEIAKHCPDLGFAIGTPVWDYWLPYHAVNRLKKTLITNRSQSLIHLGHQQNWKDAEVNIGIAIMTQNYRVTKPMLDHWITRYTSRRRTPFWSYQGE